MINDLIATSHLQGERIDLAWTWTDSGTERPGLKLIRSRRAYPGSISDGLEVADTDSLFRSPDQGWERIDRIRFLILNSAAEGDLCQAEAEFRYVAAADPEPASAAIRYYDPALEQDASATLADITRVTRSVAPDGPWDSVETLEIFHAPGGGPEVSAGTLTISTGNADSAIPDQFAWLASGEPAEILAFDRRVDLLTRRTGSSVAPEAMRFSFETVLSAPEGETPVMTLEMEETYNPDDGAWRRRFLAADHGLPAGEVYYYALFAPDPGLPGEYVTDRAWRASALATGDYGLDERLYDLLPAIHKQYDEPSPQSQGGGQLRRFLEIFGGAANQLRGMEEALSIRHDVRRAPANVLPHLARWIGWEPDLTLDENAQRRDIGMAPELFRTVGTIPNIRSLVGRITGWPCRLKEFVHNIMMTNAPETIHLWEIWRIDHDGVDWGAPSAVTVTDGFDGRPASAVDGGGDVWLFWHADRDGNRSIWLQRPGVDTEPRRADEGAPDAVSDADTVDEEPASVAVGPRIWLFFSSNRGGNWDIWARPFDGLPGGGAQRLTDHPADDRRPAAVVDGGGRIWVFFQSNRRGPTDICARVLEGGEWGLPLRITTAGFRHESPSATVDAAGRIWLFWVEDLGDRRNLFHQVLDGGVWGAPQPLTQGPHRDESPSAVFRNGRIWLFWHTNRDGVWRIWGRRHNGIDWEPAAAVTSDVTGDKEPSAGVNAGGDLHLFFRSRRRGRAYQSRTIDTNDPDMLNRLKTFEDRAHYTYDAGIEEDGPPPRKHWYARGKVGLYLTPDTADPAEMGATIARARDFVEPFRPLPVRFVWLTETPVMQEVIDTDGLIDETFEDDIA